MPDKRITLPEQDEMMERLIKAHNDPHIIRGLYPLICKKLAGQERVPVGVVMGLTFAISDYSKGLPDVVGNLAIRFIPSFVRAIVDDEEAREEAINFYKEGTANVS